MKTKYIIKTPQICEILGVSRQTLHSWEQRGKFIPPRNFRGDRVFTERQAKGILKAFSPGGKQKWHFKG